MCDLFLTFADPERLFEVSKMKRKERRRAKSDAEAGLPFRGGRGGGLSEMERTEKTSEGSAKRQKISSHFPDMEKHKKKTFQYIQ